MPDAERYEGSRRHRHRLRRARRAHSPTPLLPSSPTHFAPGDLVGFLHHGCAGFWINVGTLGLPGRGLSHIAIVVDNLRTDGQGPPLLLVESIHRHPLPCAVRGVHVSGIQAHWIESRIAEYPGRVWHFPIRQPLDWAQRMALRLNCRKLLGTRYDAPGALASRDLGLGWLGRWWFDQPEDLSSLFCSEFSYEMLERISVLPADNASRWSPNGLAREVIRRDTHGPRRRLK